MRTFSTLGKNTLGTLSKIQKYQNIIKINFGNYSQEKAKNGLGLNSKPNLLLKVGPGEPGTTGEEKLTQPQV